MGKKDDINKMTLKKTLLSVFTLNFTNNDFEISYNTSFYSNRITYIRATLILGILIFLSFLFYDKQLLYPVFQKILFLRTIIFLPIALLITGILFFKKYKAHLQVFLSLYYLNYGIVGIITSFHVSGRIYLYYFLLILIFLILASTLIRLQFFYAFICNSILLAFWLLTININEYLSRYDVIGYSILFFVGYIFSFLINYLIEKQNRYYFMLTQLNERKQKELEKTNKNLNKLVEERTAELTQSNHRLKVQIEERKHAEQKIVEQKTLLDDLFYAVSEGIAILDKNENIIFCNPALTRFFEKENLEGQNLLDLFEYNDRVVILQESGDNQNNETSFELSIKTKDGKNKFLRANIIPCNLNTNKNIASFATIYDLTRLKETEAALLSYKNHLEQKVAERTEELQRSYTNLEKITYEKIQAKQEILRFKAIFEKANFGTAIIDNDTKIVYINSYWASLFNKKNEELINEKLTDLLSESQQKTVKNILAELNSTTNNYLSDIELEIYNADNQHITLLINAIVIQDNVLDYDFIALTAINITERKKAHVLIQKQNELLQNQRNMAIKQKEKILKNNQDLQLANQKIKETTKLKDLFFANMSHEIRTPLNGINGYINLLYNMELSAKAQTYIKNIKISSKNLMLLIDDILDISKIEAGKLKFENTDFNFKELWQQILDTTNFKATEKNIQLKSSFAPDIPEYLKGDAFRLNQIISNLLSNALKFTNKNGLISVAVFKLAEDDKTIKLKFVVSDTGIGIPDEKLNHIFNDYIQADLHIKRQYGGTGLGLSIVKKLVDLQKGTIKVKSKLNKGSTFEIELLFEKTAGEAINSPNKSIKTTENELKNLKILLVEDNAINREIVIEILKTLNMNIIVDSAINGKIAIEKYEKNDYDLIIMDIQMPEIDGFQTTEYIRTMSEPKNKIAILGMSAHALQAERQKCFDVGMDDYLAKPFEPKDLFEKLKKLKNLPLNISKPKQQLIQEKSYQHINLSNLPKSYFKKTKNLLKILTMCQINIPKDIAQIKESIEKQNWKEVSDIAHSLKNLMYYLGLNQLRENLEYIEKTIKSEQDKTKIPEIFEDTSTQWQKAYQELKKIIKEYQIQE